ncbi:histidine triad nucleotide-binding protein [Candidatus Azambacteria bacterium]|nr:histidine triad nucleotide-binding protein [Candidatus Azambacteria bacterium]
MTDCLFCKIVKGEVSSTVVFENGKFLVFKDIHPKADVHVLVVPKEHIASVDHITERDKAVLGDMFLTVKDAAEKLGVSGRYRLLVNVGRDGGQEIDHLHMHILAGDRREVPRE